MRFDEFTIAFKDNVSALSIDRQIDLLLYVCKRLLPYYAEFVKEERWGNLDLALDGLNLIQQAKTSPVDPEVVKQLLPELEECIPDMDDFGSHLGSLALNASAAIYESLQFLITRDSIHVYNVGTYLTDSIDTLLQEESELNEGEIDSHPMVIEARKTLIDLSENGAQHGLLR